MINTGINWMAWSRVSNDYDIRGYTKPGKEYTKEALEACKKVSERIGKPIPSDINIQIINID